MVQVNVDNMKGTKTALTNAASIASMILTTECIVDKTWNVGLKN